MEYDERPRELRGKPYLREVRLRYRLTAFSGGTPGERVTGVPALPL